MKQLGVILSTILLLGSILSGCGSSTAPASNTTNAGTSTSATTSSAGAGNTGSVVKLNYWVPFSGGDGDFMKAMVEKFNQSQQGIQVTMLNTPSAEYYTKLRTAIAAKQGPDVAVVHVSRMPEFTPTNALESLDDVAQEAGIDWASFNQNILKATISENKHLAIPLDTHAQIMFYNKAILREAGLLDANDQPKIPAGPDGFLNYLKEIKSKVPADVMPFATTSATNQPFWAWWSLYSQLGGKLLSEDGTKAAFNNPNGLKALQLLETMVKDEVWPKNIANGGEIFIANKAALSFNGVWYVGTAEKTQGLDFGVMPIPQIFDQKAVWGDSHTLAIPTQTTDDRTKMVAAAKFANWLADNGAMWAQAGHVPSKPAALESAEFKALPNRSNYVELADYVSFLPTHEKTAAISDMMKANFNLMMNGQNTAEEVLAKSEQDANALLAK
jgi:multiple sugar transport system substrate-binding protein